MEILPDDQTPDLAAVVHRITRQSMAQQLKHSKDLGETTVIAQAVVAAEAGQTVTVLIDNGLPPIKKTNLLAPTHWS